MDKYKIMITGVSGFIGSNVAKKLLEEGKEVVGVDNLSQGDEHNMDILKGFDNFSFHKEDIMNPEAMVELSKGCKYILHLAAYKIPRYSDALDTLKINSEGSENIAKAAVANKCKVIAASTSDVYGRNPDVPFNEESYLVMGSPKVRRWAYAISKMFDEQLFFAYAERHGIDICMMRFFGGYGINQNLTWWGGPQSVFINKAIDNEEIELHGDGQQTRSFTFIEDHVDGIVRCIESEKSCGEVFNLGYTKEITIEELARTIWKLIRGDEEPKLVTIPYQTFGKYEDVLRRVPDITKAKEMLGFEPKFHIEEGLTKTIIWQLERRKLLGMPEPAKGFVFKG